MTLSTELMRSGWGGHWNGLDPDDDTVIRVDPPAGASRGWWRLQAVKATIRRMFELEGSLMIRVVSLIRTIESEELYTQEADLDGTPYRSMSAYLPALLDELKQAGWIHKLGVRQLRAYLAAYRVMVDGLKYTPDELSYIGISRVTELLEAADYNPKTGEIAEDPKPGKIGRAEFKALADEMKLAPDDWPLKAVRAQLDEARGVPRPWVKFDWGQGYDDQVAPLTLTYFDGEETFTYDFSEYRVDYTTWPRSRVLKMLRLLNAMSNLTEED